MISRLFVASLLFCAIALTATADGPTRDTGRWRLEAGGTNGVYSGRTDREKDYYFTGRIEYEYPVSPQFALGAKVLPLFIFHDDNRNDTVYGIGIGVTARWYWNKETRTGLFNEISGSVLWHSREFENNNSRVNFLTEAGLGYAFPGTPWHVTAKLEHISNGGLRGKNQSVNGIGLAIGYSF